MTEDTKILHGCVVKRIRLFIHESFEDSKTLPELCTAHSNWWNIIIIQTACTIFIGLLCAYISLLAQMWFISRKICRRVDKKINQKDKLNYPDDGNVYLYGGAMCKFKGMYILIEYILWVKIYSASEIALHTWLWIIFWEQCYMVYFAYNYMKRRK